MREVPAHIPSGPSPIERRSPKHPEMTDYDLSTPRPNSETDGQGHWEHDLLVLSGFDKPNKVPRVPPRGLPKHVF